MTARIWLRRAHRKLARICNPCPYLAESWREFGFAELAESWRGFVIRAHTSQKAGADLASPSSQKAGADL